MEEQWDQQFNTRIIIDGWSKIELKLDLTKRLINQVIAIRFRKSLIYANFFFLCSFLSPN